MSWTTKRHTQERLARHTYEVSQEMQGQRVTGEAVRESSHHPSTHEGYTNYVRSHYQF
ncbi:MAG TPA: hypothetical protein VIZ18_00295 [Ktedonobacteraceae bacterium]